MAGFYPRLRDQRRDDPELQDCIETVVNRLEQHQTSEDKPGMLLGKIQSGKTRGFLGVIAKAFDRGYDIALVFTKGTKTLATQTVRRISRDFAMFIDDEEVSVFDIMQMPERLTRSERRRKLIFVAKKEVNNLKRVNQLFMNPDYPEFKGKRVLLIDDEADMASVRFVQKDGDYEQGAIAQQMDNLRSLVGQIAFLQVTATPYALYLQPDDYPPQGPDAFVFLPKRPAFTALLPIHGGYVGGDDYFGDFEETDPRYHLFVSVPTAEQDALRSEDGRTIREDRIWTSANISVLRRAVMTFLVAVGIRRWQQAQEEERGHGKFAMIIHNDTQRSAHKWQWDTVERLRVAFEGVVADGDDAGLRKLFEPAYDDIKASVMRHAGSSRARRTRSLSATSLRCGPQASTYRPALTPSTAGPRHRRWRSSTANCFSTRSETASASSRCRSMRLWNSSGSRRRLSTCQRTAVSTGRPCRGSCATTARWPTRIGSISSSRSGGV
jgi:hypothetical protein